MYQNAFHFTVDADLDTLQPLFGADGERRWAPGWDPRFVHPETPRDVEGMVFTIQHPLGEATWVNTAFERDRVQYVYVIPGVVATTITLRLRPAPDATRTSVDVTYARAPLSPAAREHVAALSRADAAAGPEWAALLAAAVRAPTSTRGR